MIHCTLIRKKESNRHSHFSPGNALPLKSLEEQSILSLRMMHRETSLSTFLTQTLNTVDGKRDTAQFYIDSSLHYEIERREKRLNRKV